MSGQVFKIENIEQDAIDFLLYSYFGIDNRNKEQLKEGPFKRMVAIKCAQRAYLDLARTLTYNEELKKKGGKEEKQGIICRKEFSNIICEFIAESIEKKIFGNPKNFCDMHNKICAIIDKNAKRMRFKKGEGSNYIILISGKQNESFYYGQAQKWLNMTLKYMWLIGLWKEEFEEIKDENGNLNLHVPVDSYIMQAASEELKIESSNKPWSQWDDDDYFIFQREVAKKTSECGGRMFWEKDAWIQYAEESKEKEMDNLKIYKKEKIAKFHIYQEYIDEKECEDVNELNNIFTKIIGCEKA